MSELSIDADFLLSAGQGMQESAKGFEVKRRDLGACGSPSVSNAAGWSEDHATSVKFYLADQVHESGVAIEGVGSRMASTDRILGAVDFVREIIS